MRQALFLDSQLENGQNNGELKDSGHPCFLWLFGNDEKNSSVDIGICILFFRQGTILRVV